jgi:copper chaperone CopZ
MAQESSAAVVPAVPDAPQAAPRRSPALALAAGGLAGVLAVKYSLKRVPGVLDASVDYSSQTATVRFESSQTDADTIAAATGKSGYPSRAVAVTR